MRPPISSSSLITMVSGVCCFSHEEGNTDKTYFFICTEWFPTKDTMNHKGGFIWVCPGVVTEEASILDGE